jgi:hypothetical protein
LIFFGIDNKPKGQLGHASAYLASDSWITRDLGDKIELLRADAQKVFISRTEPAIFGYVGDERFEKISRSLVNVVDWPNGGILNQTHGSSAKANQLEEMLAAAVPLTHESKIVYVGMDRAATDEGFHLWAFNFTISGVCTREELFVPAQSGPPIRRRLDGGSDEVFGVGTGANLLRGRDSPTLGDWSRQENLVCAYYRALRHALSVHHDPRSGGTLQMATLHRGGRASYVGVVEEGVCYVAGKACEPAEDCVSRFVDKDFNEVRWPSFTRRFDRKQNPPLLQPRTCRT